MDGEIRPSELEPKLGTDDEPLVVDIRQPGAFEREHIPGSVNIPFPNLPQQVDRVTGEDHVVTVCPHGEASIRAARLITAFEGFDGTVESLETGLTGWDGPTDGDTHESEQSSNAPF